MARLRNRIVARLLAGLVALTCAVSVAAEPIFLVLDEPQRRAVLEGTEDRYAGAEIQRLVFDPVTSTFDRQDATLVGSNQIAVSDSRLVATADDEGQAQVDVRAGNDDAFASVTLLADEPNAGQLPLQPIGFELQTVTFEDDGLADDTEISVDINYFMQLDLQSPDTSFSAGIGSDIWVFERTPLATPAETGRANLFVAERVFAANFGFDSATEGPLTSLSRTLSEQSTFAARIGVEYVVFLSAGARVDYGSAGLSLSAMTDPTFSFDNCAICTNATAVRTVTVPEPALCGMLLLGLAGWQLRRPKSTRLT